MVKDTTQQIKLINQALAAAQASIELSKQLLAELMGVPVPTVANPIKVMKAPERASSMSVPGTTGTYDGENMVTASGQKYPVPANYASKTVLVFGDTLKMVDSLNSLDSGASGKAPLKLFKQIERVKRQRVTGVLTQKDNGWYLTNSDGSYKVLEAAVKHYGLNVGDSVMAVLPKDNAQSTFAALEGPEIPAEVKVPSTVPSVTVAAQQPGEKPGADSVMETDVSKLQELKEKKEPSKNAGKPEKKRPDISGVKVPEVVEEVPSIKKDPEKKTEKPEKKSGPIISEDDLR